MKRILLLLLITGFLAKPATAQVPDVTLADCSGVSHSIYQDLAAGNAVILKFCAGWCAPCSISNPLFESVWQEFNKGTCKVKMYSMLFETNAPGETTDCSFGLQYADHYNLTMPMITNIGTWNSGLTGQFASLYNIYAIPTTLVILPNQANPANSIVKVIVGVGFFDPVTQTETWLDEMIKDSLATGGFYSNKFDIIGSLCSNAPYSLTLTSQQPDNNLWSTGATTQSITINQPGPYTLTRQGCSYTKDIQFTPIPVPGIAAISSPTVCLDGQYTLSYAVPPNSPQDIMWVYRSPGDFEWNDFLPADAGPLTLETGNYYPAGTSFEFAVRVRSGGVCTVYSNVVTITVIDVKSGTLAGVAAGPTNPVCFYHPFTLSYTGGQQGAQWVILNGDEYWEAFASADQPVNPAAITYLNRRNAGSDKFRVRYFDGNCYSYSDIIEVFYLFQSLQITGPPPTCAGAQVTLGLNGDYTNILWSTSATTATINVNPLIKTIYSVTATEANGCRFTDDYLVHPIEKSKPVITYSSPGTVCGSGPVTLSFAGTSIATPCINAPYGQYPNGTFTVSNCNGLPEEIISNSYLGTFSVVNVVAGNYYKFTAEITAFGSGPVIITLVNEDGSEVYATGINSVIYKAGITGEVFFIISPFNCESDANGQVRTMVACSANPSVFGSFLWMPGGQTTPSITVSPSQTTNYTLTFTQADNPCSAPASKQVIVGIGSLELTTTNITCNSATLNWSTPFNPTQWELEYKSTNQGSRWVNVPVASLSTRSVTITGLKKNQNYQWHIRAKCGRSTTPYSNLVEFITLPVCATSKGVDEETEEMLTPEIATFDAVVMPNPSTTNFRVSISSGNLKTPIQAVITDMLGRKLETRTVTAGEVITVGDNYRSGVYILRLMQGTETRQVKLIKL